MWLLAAALACAPVQGSEAVLRPGRLVIFGEMHGTEEIPSFLGDLVCAAVRAHRRVHVGLELPGESGPIWSDPYQSGRTSVAMRRLIGRLHQLGAQIFWFDSTAAEREGAMADAISAERRKAPKDLYLVLVGNLHARKKPGAPWDPTIRWMAQRLAGRERRLITLDVRYREGSAWICQSDKPEACKATSLRGTQTGRDWAIAMSPQPAGYDGTFSVGAITAS